jgi:hypothetical protein
MLGLGLRRHVTINSNCRRAKVLFLLLALSLSQFTPLLAADPEASSPPKLLTRAELKSAVEKGEKIVGREINGGDIIAALTPWIISDSKCVPNASLHIEKSVIRGDVRLEFKAPPAKPSSKQTAEDPDDDNTEESNTKDSKHRLAHWLTIPLLIKESTVTDGLQIDSLGFACIVDLSYSTFESGTDIRSTTFGADVSAVGTVFKTGTEVLGTNFKSTAKFWRAKFVGNVEFIGTMGRKSVFDGNADFRESVFSRHVSFLGSVFMKRMDFRNAQFASVVSFGDAKLAAAGVVSQFSGPFYGTDFGGFANFRNAHFARLRFLRSFFHDGADFRGASGNRLQLHGVTVSGRLGFDDARSIKELEFDSFGGSMILNGEAVFRRAAFDKLTAVRTAFKSTVDFQGTEIRSSLTLRIVSFDGDLHFEDAKLPGSVRKSADKSDDDENPQINVNDITLNKGLYIDANQFLVKAPWWALWRENMPRLYANETTKESDDSSNEPKQARDDRRVWRELMRAFDLAKNVELKNYAEYKLRVLEESSVEAREAPAVKMASVASRWFWGYGLRPVRVLFWLVVVVLAFAGIYWTQLPNTGPGRVPVVGSLGRASYAFVFSVRTAWELTYGYNNSANFVFRAITTAESIIAKLLLACFAYALTQTSPLLSELTKKLLP